MKVTKLWRAAPPTRRSTTMNTPATITSRMALLLGLALASAAPAAIEVRKFETGTGARGPRFDLEFSKKPKVLELKSGDPRRWILSFPGTIHRPVRTRLKTASKLAPHAVLSQHDRNAVWLVVRRDPAAQVRWVRDGAKVRIEVEGPASAAGVTVAPPPVAQASPSPAPTPRPGGKPRIVIDPGHGGRDPGAVGKRTTDKAVALAVAKELKALFDGDDRVEVHFTRLEDKFVKLEDRAALARRVGADVFVSLHANAGHRAAHGFEVWYLSLKGSRTTADKVVAQRENGYQAAGGDTGPVHDVITRIQMDMRRETNLNQSSLLAGVLNEALGKTGQRSRGVHYADFAVLRSVDVPSVLLELGFLTHAREEAQLMNPAFRKKQAKAIRKGILDYLRSQGLLETETALKPMLYAVRSRDTLEVIGRRFGVTAEALAEANGLQLTSRLIVGQVLRIPRDPVADLLSAHIE